MNSLILRRAFAILLDYLIIVLYGVVLYTITISIYDQTSLSSVNIGPVQGQIIGLFSITIPVFLYFVLTERSRQRASLGKRLVGLSISRNDSTQKANIWYRNFLKFIPWEIAHFGVHWIIYYSRLEQDIPLWIWVSLIIPQLLVFIYVISAIINKGSQTVYDRMANTQVKIKSKSNEE